MQQIADWLEKLGMSAYAQRFAVNDIDLEVLSELTDSDFDRLGVSIGHRRKMIRAIRDFAASPVSAVTERSAPAAITAPAAPTDTAERRDRSRHHRSNGDKGNLFHDTFCRYSAARWKPNLGSSLLNVQGTLQYPPAALSAAPAAAHAVDESRDGRLWPDKGA